MADKMMTSKPHLQHGVSLIETMVTIAVMAIILGLATPSLSLWMKNTQIKSTSQNLLTGLQLARGEAVRQNSRVLFELTGGASGVPTWTVSLCSSSCTTTIQSSQSDEGGATVRLGVSADDLSAANYSYASMVSAGTGMNVSPLPGVVFNAFGQVVENDATIATRITRIDITDTKEANARRMVVRIPAGGSATLCDPALQNSQGC